MKQELKNIKRYICILVLLSLMLTAFSSCARTQNESDGSDTGSSSATEQAGVGRSTTEEDSLTGQVDRNKTICIDPGHGFGDIGAGSEYIGDLSEKDINLKFAKFLSDELASRGYDVFMTHDGESFPKTEIDNGNNNYDYKERTAYANSVGMDYFISIHCNTYDGYQDVQGVRIYYSEDSRVPVKEPEKAAGFLCESLKSAFPDYRKPLSYMTEADNSYYVTHWAEACALLIEIGYLTNKTDAENMLNDEWNKNMAIALADGIDKYFN